MPEMPADSLAFEAYLYATEQLAGPRLHAFEARLAGDQAARDALSLAVRRMTHLVGETGPDASYRAVVRERLGLGEPSFLSRGWRYLWGPYNYHGHPLAWGLLGAVAAVALVWNVGQPSPQEAAVPEPTGLVAETSPQPASVEATAEAEEVSHELATLWADMHSSDHLTRVVSEEGRRRQQRQEERVAERSDSPPAPSSAGID